MGKPKDRHGILPCGKARGEATPLQVLVDETVDEWWREKHREQSPEEIAFLNSIVPDRCPLCLRAGPLTRWGKDRKGRQRWLCRACGKTFSPLKGTLFQDAKIPISEWVEMIAGMLEFHSTKSSSFDNRNAPTTGYYWEAKIFAALDGWRGEAALGEEFWLDEFFWDVDPEGRVLTPQGKRLRGISRNKVCVICATDGATTVAAVAGTGKPTRAMMSAIAPCITPGSTMHDDGEKAHAALVESLSLRRVCHPTKDTKGLPDELNPMDPINDVHDKMKMYLRSHRSFLVGKLQGLLDLFCFRWSRPGMGVYEVAGEIIKLAVSRRKVIKYRTFYAPKGLRHRKKRPTLCK